MAYRTFDYPVTVLLIMCRLSIRVTLRALLMALAGGADMQKLSSLHTGRFSQMGDHQVVGKT